MANVECPFCHEMIPEREIEAHYARHLADRGDGQQRDYATLRPEQRVQDDLSGVPQVYQHLKCGVATRMPEEIVRTYLVDPWFYNSDRTFCCGCSAHVPNSECVWTETGENLQEYMNELRAAHKGTSLRLAAEPLSVLTKPRVWLWIVLAVVVLCVVLAMAVPQRRGRAAAPGLRPAEMLTLKGSPICRYA